MYVKENKNKMTRDKGLDIFRNEEFRPSVADIRILVPKYPNNPKAKDPEDYGNAYAIAKKIDNLLLEWAKKGAAYDTETFLTDVECPRFQNGEAKAVLNESVRGKDIFIICDVGDYSRTYTFFDNKSNCMSPDDHFQDLKRIIQAVAGKAHRITVIMPFLYAGRQHHRNLRESLDCACMLQELKNMGVDSILTVDAHNDQVSNAVPLMGFDNIIPSYQMLKRLFNCKINPDNTENSIVAFKGDKMNPYNLNFDKLMIISPDLGAVHRNDFYAKMLGCDLGIFSKKRDFKTVIDGKNPIVGHDYIGGDVNGRDILTADDMIASGGSVIDVVKVLKEKGANRIFVYSTYALFTKGLAEFDEAFEKGWITAVLATNLTYRTPELLKRPWFLEVDVSKYLAYFIAAVNHNCSLGEVIRPEERITRLIEGLKKL